MSRNVGWNGASQVRLLLLSLAIQLALLSLCLPNSAQTQQDQTQDARHSLTSLPSSLLGEWELYRFCGQSGFKGTDFTKGDAEKMVGTSVRLNHDSVEWGGAEIAIDLIHDQSVTESEADGMFGRGHIFSRVGIKEPAVEYLTVTPGQVKHGKWIRDDIGILVKSNSEVIIYYDCYFFAARHRK